MQTSFTIGLAAAALAFLQASGALAEGNPIRGKRAFLKCVICHSVKPKVHKTGPSLARIWGRKAGTVEGFPGYSNAMKSSGIIWDGVTLDEFLRSPRSLVPRTRMKMRGLASASERQDIIAYLKQLTAENKPVSGHKND